ncbi:MAG: DUF5666 domain-containing protein [Betaproteobacteria bacterium]
MRDPDDRATEGARRIARRLLPFCTLVAGALVALTAQPQPVPAQRIDAVVVALDGAALQLRPRGGGDPVRVTLDDSTRIGARSASALERILQGAYIGTTAIPAADATLTAVEVHIFAESMRGTGEGHRPMAGAPGSTMANATVSSATGAAPTRSTTTSATVTKSSAAPESLRLTLAYAGGEKVVAVPATTPVELIEPADRSTLVPGANVAVYAVRRPDGGLVAERINVGKNGYVPAR